MTPFLCPAIVKTSRQIWLQFRPYKNIHTYEQFVERFTRKYIVQNKIWVKNLLEYC